ncbi:hypothetical protein VNO78_08964 [Psophocarpus tetragonolobus]|uniref:Uncharacterized protein n=1 Tax=Psophocarpus tetragonolobus TaxID=3891 RepID=A0AAN9SVS7_PSOTE
MGREWIKERLSRFFNFPHDIEEPSQSHFAILRCLWFIAAANPRLRLRGCDLAPTHVSRVHPPHGATHCCDSVAAHLSRLRSPHGPTAALLPISLALGAAFLTVSLALRCGC